MHVTLIAARFRLALATAIASAFYFALTVSGTGVAQAAEVPSCSAAETPVVRVHSDVMRTPTRGSGLLVSNDDSIYVALDEPARSAATRWSLEADGKLIALLSPWHSFLRSNPSGADLVLPSEERVAATTTTILLSDGLHDLCTFPLRVLPLKLPPSSRRLIAILAPRATPMKNPEHYDSVGIGAGSMLRDVSLNFTAGIPESQSELRMTGHLELDGNKDFISTNLVALFTSDLPNVKQPSASDSTNPSIARGTPRLQLDASTPATFAVAAPSAKNWSEPQLVLSRLELGNQGSLETDDCLATGAWQLPGSVRFLDSGTKNGYEDSIPLVADCFGGRITAFHWKALSAKNVIHRGLINWDASDRAPLGNDTKLGVCPLLRAITISVEPPGKNVARYVAADGSVGFNTSSKQLDCRNATAIAASSKSGSTLAFDDLHLPEATIDDIGVATDRSGKYHPTAHFRATYANFDRLLESAKNAGPTDLSRNPADESIDICGVEGEFVANGDHEGIDLTIATQLKAELVVPTPIPSAPPGAVILPTIAPPGDDADESTSTPSPCQGETPAPGATAAPRPPADAAATPTPVATDIAHSTPIFISPLKIAITVKNIKAFLPKDKYRYILSPTHWREYNFQNASLDIGHNTVFGRDVESCSTDTTSADATASRASATPSPDPSASPSATASSAPKPEKVAALNKVALAPNRLCIGLHLSPQHGSSDNDTAYGLLDLCKQPLEDGDKKEDDAVNGETGNMTCAPELQARSAFVATGLTAQLPSSSPAKIRLGLTSLTVNDFKVETVKNSPDFDNAIGPDRLQYLGCTDLHLVGSASFAVLDAQKSTPFTILSGAAQLGSAASAVQQSSTTDAFTVTPSIAMGQGCTVFSMQGFVPIALSPQSLITVTSIVFAASKDGDGRDLFFFNAAGSVTTGNVTAVFSSIGFRTLAKRHIPSGKPKPKPAYLVDVCQRPHHETQFGNLCVVSDINWPLTGGITAAQNASAITQALTGLAGAAFGIAIKH